MSSTRRSASEVHILAMLDRQEAGGRPRRALRALRRKPAVFRYGVAGVLAFGLVGTLAWLAHDSAPPAAADAALASGMTPGGQAPDARAVQPPAPAAVSLPLPVPGPGAASAARQEAEEHPAAGSGATIVDMAPDAPAGPEVLAEAAPAPAAARAVATAARAAPRAAALKKSAPGVRAPALAHAEPRGRHPASSMKHALKTAPKATPGAAVDTDVALISAIIQHANSRQEAEEAARKP